MAHHLLEQHFVDFLFWQQNVNSSSPRRLPWTCTSRTGPAEAAKVFLFYTLWVWTVFFSFWYTSLHNSSTFINITPPKKWCSSLFIHQEMMKIPWDPAPMAPANCTAACLALQRWSTTCCSPLGRSWHWAPADSASQIWDMNHEPWIPWMEGFIMLYLQFWSLLIINDCSYLFGNYCQGLPRHVEGAPIYGNLNGERNHQPYQPWMFGVI